MSRSMNELSLLHLGYPLNRPLRMIIFTLFTYPHFGLPLPIPNQLRTTPPAPLCQRPKTEPKSLHHPLLIRPNPKQPNLHRLNHHPKTQTRLPLTRSPQTRFNLPRYLTGPIPEAKAAFSGPKSPSTSRPRQPRLHPDRTPLPFPSPTKVPSLTQFGIPPCMTNIMLLFEMVLGSLFLGLSRLMWFVVSGCLDTNSGLMAHLSATRTD